MHKKLLICICAVSALAAMGCNESKDWKKTPECGNQILEIGEECDTTTSKLCSNYDATKVWEESGRPGCNASCKLTIGTCVEKGTHVETCGNGVLDPGEACDGSLFANSSESCETYEGTGATGNLACVNCRVSTASCVAAASCGNNVIEGDEKCDGTDLGEETCASLVEGSVGGSLSCVACTTIDTSNCEMPDLCGNGEIDDGEECDGEDIGDVTCEDGKGEGATGDVSCDRCKLVYTACRSADTPESCGDGNETIDEGEECDGDNLNDLTCNDLDDTMEGSLSCDADCHFVKTACTPINLCGNGEIDEGEDCDGDNLNEATCHSVDENLSGDGLKCNSECKFDLTGCMLDENHCGDGIVNYGEECDINLSLEGLTCDAFDSDAIGGAISCKADCTFDKSECEYENPVVCGDDNVQGSEECDNNNFNGKTCEDYAGTGATGDLVCESCVINHDACVAAPFCGDGVRNGEDECEGSDFGGKTCEDYAGVGATGDLVCESCVINHDACVAAPFCGDGVRNGEDECEGDDIGGAVCPDGTVGTPVCKADCTLDMTVCAPATCNNNVLDEGEACDPTVVSYSGIACNVSNTNTSDLYNVGSISCSNACAIVEDCNEKAGADFTVTKLFETYYGGLMTAKMSKFTNDTKKRQVTSRHADRGVTWNLATLAYDEANFSLSFANWVAGTDGAPNFDKYIQVELLKLPESDVMDGTNLVTTPIGAKLISDFDYVAVKIDFKRASSTSPKNFALTLYDGDTFKAVLKNFGSENFSSFASTGEVTFSVKDLTNPIVRINSYDKGGAVLFKNLEVRALNSK